MGLRRIASGLVALALALVGTACGSNGLPKGSVAPTASADAPFGLAITPPQAKHGERVVLSVSGDRSGDWMGGVATHVDLEVDGAWRTLWWITDANFGDQLLPIDTPGVDPEVLAVGFDLTKDFTFTVQATFKPRRYRVCRAYLGPERRDEKYVCAFLVVTRN